MKVIASVVSCMLLPALLLAAEVNIGDNVLVRKTDRRLVGTTTVDVSSVHVWLQTRKGDRPLKHWKQLQVLNIKGSMSTMVQCVVKTEEGKLDEILIKNLPPQVPEFLAAFANEAVAITNLQTELATHLAAARRAEASTPPQNQDLEQYLEEVLNQKSRIDLEEAAYKQKSETLQTLLRNHEAMRAKAAEAITVLAMNTMRKFANFPVWDCGLQK